MNPYRVLVADDYPQARSLIGDALAATERFVVCAEAADADTAIELALQHRPDICILDIRMPGNGITAARRISRSVPESIIVMLTVSRDDVDLLDALRAGASGYILKGLGDDELVGALEQAVGGEVCLSGTLVSRLVEEFRDREQRRIPARTGPAAKLSSREWDIVELLQKGASTRVIAHRLDLDASTVGSHVSSIMRKLRVASRRELVRLVQAAGQ